MIIAIFLSLTMKKTQTTHARNVRITKKRKLLLLNDFTKQNAVNVNMLRIVHFYCQFWLTLKKCSHTYVDLWALNGDTVHIARATRLRNETHSNPVHIVIVQFIMLRITTSSTNDWLQILRGNRHLTIAL